MNRLGAASSPYLQQHATNPVHWWEWGEDAFAAARSRGVPVLLSVGYATCHWCHVMAHESFEDPATADMMNRWFVCIKVDREERPDVDRIYMDAVQATTGRGGWPMTVFLTPEGEPFHAGTYFPPRDRPGHPSFTRVLAAVHEAWTDRRGDLEEQGRRLAALVAAPAPAGPVLDRDALIAAYRHIGGSFDARFGGFGGAPKFPQVPTLEYLLRIADEPWASDAAGMVATTLQAMAAGGIHDHIGGGFARYSVDSTWTVPHFEKMLYDNAQLLRIYARASQVLADPAMAVVARRTAGYLLADLRLAEGGFASGEDADSEGAEGTFYVFGHDEVRAAGASPAVLAALGVTPQGNFEGRNVLTRRRSDSALQPEIESTLAALGRVRSQRPRPLRDDKVVAAWNGLAVRALAEAGTALGETAWITAAVAAAEFVLGEMRPAGRLHRSWRAGRLGPAGFCDDSAAMALGCFSLYRATGSARWYDAAAELTGDLVDRFADADGPGFFATASDAERLIARPKNAFDLPTPSDNALAAEALIHLAAYTGATEWWERLEATLRIGAAVATRHPAGAGHFLAVAHTAALPPLEVAIVGPDPAPLVAVVEETFRPHVFLAWGAGASAPLLADRPAPTTGALAHVCRGFVCDSPIAEPDALRAALVIRALP